MTTSASIFESAHFRPTHNIWRIRSLVLLFVASLHLVIAIGLLKPADLKPKKPSTIMEVAMVTLPKPEPVKVEPVKEPPPAPVVKEEPIKPVVKPKPVVVKPPEPVKKVAPPKPIAQPKVLTTVTENAETSIPKFEAAPTFTPSTPPVVSQTVAVAKASKPAETSGHGRDDSKSTGVDCSKREPVYPPRLKSRHVEGWVKVEFTVNTEGEVTDAVVVNSEPADIFDDAALNAVNKWDCRAKIVNGAAVPQRATQTFKFQLEN